MRDAELNLLRQISRDREMSLADATRSLCPIGPRSHKDVYPLAMLIKGGYVNFWVDRQEGKFEEQREIDIAIHLYMTVMQKGDLPFTYLGRTVSGGHGFEDLPIFLTAQGALYLSELAAKRQDRAWSILVGILVGTSVGIAALVAKRIVAGSF